MKKLIFATQSNKKLARKIAKEKKFVLGKVKIGRFADGEISVFLKEKVKRKKVYVLGSTFPPAENALELLILINTLKENGAKKIIVIIPYFGYAKADHIDPPGSALTAKLMAQAIELAGADEVRVVNLHSKQGEKFFKVRLKHLSVMPLLADYFKKKKIKNLAIASPDLGGVKRAKEFAKELKNKDLIKIKKYRSAPDKAKVSEVVGEVKGKNVVIVDDMIQSGGTIIKAVRALKKQGAKDIYVAVAHLVFTGPSVALLNKEKNIKQVVLTNTISPTIKLPQKFKKVLIDDLIIDNL